ncbi:MAG: hypothetical protein AAB518_03905 [Patescibacteria group bacterium]
MAEALAFVLVLPILVMLFGFTLIALGDVSGAFIFPIAVWFAPLALILFLALRPFQNAKGYHAQVGMLKHWIVIASLSVLIPLFIRHIFVATDKHVGVIIGGLILGFTLAAIGMFIKNNWTFARSNLVGGGITVIYLYTQLWQLGEGARIAAAAVGLIIAVVISIIKLRERLT